MLLPATCIRWNSKGVLITGESGSGKSDLALRLINEGMILIADGQVKLEREDGFIYASSPEELQGRLEVRGLGLLKFPYSFKAPVTHVLELVPRDKVKGSLEKERFFDCLGVELPLLSLHAFDVSTPLKLRLWLSSYK